MKFTRHFAAVAVAVTAFVAGPSAQARTPLCPDCVVEAVVQGSGIMPDPTRILLRLKVVSYSTDPLAVPQIFNLEFDGLITDGDPNSSSGFQATGSITSDIPVQSVFNFNVASGATLGSDPDLNVDSPGVPSPVYLNGEDNFGFKLFATLLPKVQTGLPALNLWDLGHPFVGTAHMFGPAGP